MDFLVTHGEAILFYVFAATAVASALCVVAMRNPVYGAISLLVTFLAVGALFLLRHAQFLFAVQVFVYGGGIMVLFLFVIMLVNLHRLSEDRAFLEYLPAAVILVVLLVGVLVFAFLTVSFPPPDLTGGELVTVEGEALGNTQAVAWRLYRDYLLPFEIASVFLLVAMIGAVVLGRKA